MVGCMALSSTCVPLCHSSQMALSAHSRFLLHDTNWMAKGPDDLPSCIGWLFCDHSFSFPFPTTIVSPSFSTHPFFSRLLLHGCLKMMLGMNLMATTSISSSFFLFQCSQSIMWASVSVPTDSVPTTQSPKRGGDYRAMASCVMC